MCVCVRGGRWEGGWVGEGGGKLEGGGAWGGRAAAVNYLDEKCGQIKDGVRRGAGVYSRTRDAGNNKHKCLLSSD